MKLVPVDSDPFTSARKLTPVDNDPFAVTPPAAPLHDQNLGQLPGPVPQGPLHDRAPMPLQAAPANAQTLKTDQVMSQGQQAGGPLVQAMLNPNLPVGARALAGAGHELWGFLKQGPDAIQSAVQSLRQGEQPSPDTIGQGAMSMLPGALETGGVRAPKPVEAPARVEPLPLTETRAREAGIGAVAKVADRTARLTPVEHDPFGELKPPELPPADPRAKALGEAAVGKVADRADEKAKYQKFLIKAINNDLTPAERAEFAPLHDKYKGEKGAKGIVAPFEHAFKYKGVVYSGVEHMDAMEYAARANGVEVKDLEDKDIGMESFGSIDKDGRFVPYEDDVSYQDKWGKHQTEKTAQAAVGKVADRVNPTRTEFLPHGEPIKFEDLAPKPRTERPPAPPPAKLTPVEHDPFVMRESEATGVQSYDRKDFWQNRFPDKPEPKRPPAPKPAAPSVAPPDRNDISHWKQKSGKKGYTDGGVYEDETGTEHYVKFPPKPEVAANELLANRLYKKLGVAVLDLKQRVMNGKPALASKMEKLEQFDVNNPEHVKAARKNFAAHAWLSNRDVVGNTFDNQAIGPNGEMVTVDSGGALKYKGIGEPKTDFGNTVTEWDGLQNPPGPSLAGKVFKGMTPKEMKESAKPVLALSDADIHALVPDKKLAETLIARRDDIAKKVAALPKKASSPKIKPTIPPGTNPHVAKLIEKGNNFFADQAKVQPPTSLSMTPAARIKRAKTMGFNTGLTLYHGTSKDFTEFDIGKSHGGEYAIFTSNKPGISANYGGKHVLPLWGKFENPKTIENFGSYNNAKMKDAIKQAKAEGYTELIVKGMHDLGGKQTQYLFFKPENLRARDAAVFDPKKAASPNLLSAAAATGPHATAVALPDPDIKGTVRTLADKLYRTERRHDATQREALEEVQKLPPEAARLGEKFFNMLEPGGKKPTLTPEEKALFDKHLKPWLQEQRDLYEEIKKLAPDMLPADYDPDYVHHLVEGKTPEFDEQIGIVSHEPNSPWFGSKTLPRTTRSLKNSKYYVLDDGVTRQVIMLDDKGNAYRMLGKKPINIPPHTIKGDVAPGETISIAGKKYNIGRASVAEKESATNIKYYKNAYLSTYSNVVRLKKVAEALKFFEQTKEQFQHDPQVMPLARWPGDKRNIPKNFRTTTLPGWEGWKFDPHLAETMDDWHNKPGEEWYENLKNITHGVVGTLFLLPFRHIANVAGHYYVGRMGDALGHGALPTGQHFARAMWDVLKQGPMTKDMLKAGSGMQLTKVLNADFNKQLLKGLEKQWKQNPKEWGWLFKKLGVNPVDIYNGWLKASSTAMWYMSDVMMQALVREKMARGMNLEDAIRSAEKDIPNYRINPRVMMDNQAGRAMSRYLQNNLFSVFGRYNNNKWRAVADMVSDIMKGGDPGTRKEGVAKALALASLVYFVGWPLTGAVQSLTGKKDKEASPFGPVDVTDKLKRFAELVAPQTMKRMGATDDQVDAVKLLQSFIGVSTGIEQSVEQGTGHNPFTNQEDMTLGERGQSLVETISPIQMATEMATGKTSLLEQALKSTIGMRSKPREAPVAVQKREEKARDKREMQQPINHAINQVLRKLQPFTPDAIVNRFLPSSQ